MGFEYALMQLKAGKTVSREGWNGPGQYLQLQRPDEHSKMTLPYIYIKTTSNDLVPWLASQGDLLAEDWVTVVVTKNGDLFDTTPAELDEAIAALGDMGTPPIG